MATLSRAGENIDFKELLLFIISIKSSFERALLVDKWNPYEIAVFEAAMGLFGKQFHIIADLVGE